MLPETQELGGDADLTSTCFEHSVATQPQCCDAKTKADLPRRKEKERKSRSLSAQPVPSHKIKPEKPPISPGNGKPTDEI